MNSIALDRNIATIFPQGSINASNAVAFKKQLIETIATQNASFLLVDMEQVNFLDSAGLMAFVAAYRLSKSLGRRLALCSVAPSVKIIFDLTQLDNTFEIFENRRAFEQTLS
ncbi:STAS domain-containing protein [Lusitaniella coriacea LEGE 07157]|uniref:Anti-sigma factor antagonist n=1 Tax=Lusitaniella coriacea LEGE 07157 TaxID=945747 RepID=A0A8J7E295_9CYAN|nr:STAS domain-containing protein [Lusitaniella coriacea]MBE9118692.1 STAS domain-containing protein [Lusitaniella coriacea LEGE 07157]